VPGPLRLMVGSGWPRTPGPLGRLDSVDPDITFGLLGDTPGPLGVNDWAEPSSGVPTDNDVLGRPVLLAMLGNVVALQAVAVSGSPEYRPDLGVNDATIEAFDRHFDGTLGLRLKQELEGVAKRVDVNPGLLASYLFAERNDRDIWLNEIGIDSWNTYAKDIKKKVRASKDVTVTGQETNVVNEKLNTLPSVPIIRADDAILANGSYLKYAEVRMSEFVSELGGAWDRLPIEERFTLARYGANAGLGAGRAAVQTLLGLKRVVAKGKSRLIEIKSGEILNFDRRPLGADRIEASHRKYPLRAATVHAAQAIHLSQKIFGIAFQAGNSVLFVH
jgi:hypothetical protein